MGEVRYALRFMSGKYEGGEFPLEPNREFIIGRASSIDMTLVEDMVSRHHAKITTAGREILIEDLGSTNGTFVNGEKISRVELRVGDRILVGTSIIKLVEVGEEEPTSQHAPADPQPRRNSTASRPMSGAIEEIPLADLLQLLSTSRKTGVLRIDGEQGVGRIHLREGQIFFASIDEDYNVRPEKAVFRLLRWERGEFELEPSVDINVIHEISQPTAHLLMDGVRQLDEFETLSGQLPPRNQRLAVPTPLAGRLAALSEGELDAFQLVLDHGSVAGILDNFPGSDLDAAQAIVSLLQKDFVVKH